MEWFSLIIAGLFEAFGVAMMNQLQKTKNWQTIFGFILGFSCSLLFLGYSLKSISMGTAYAIWTGIAVVFGTLIGMIFYGESRNWKRLFFIGIILCSAVGLKLIS